MKLTPKLPKPWQSVGSISSNPRDNPENMFQAWLPGGACIDVSRDPQSNRFKISATHGSLELEKPTHCGTVALTERKVRDLAIRIGRKWT